MNREKQNNPVEILIVEDNQGDLRFALEALKETTIKANTSVLRDGEEAINYLKQLGKYSKRPKPRMILLDINLPKKTGHEVLEFIKTQKSLKDIFVAMLTSSENEDDIRRAYKNKASGYIIKKADCKELAKNLEDFWGFASIKRKEFFLSGDFEPGLED